jgi:hypothetical protein
MDDIHKLIPKDKFDTSGIETLKKIEVNKVVPILGALLEWIQDINWPIATELIKILPRFHLQLMPHIHAVFESDDDIWKCWILDMLKRFPPETIGLLSVDIRRIAFSPTESEALEEADQYARNIVVQFQL